MLVTDVVEVLNALGEGWGCVQEDSVFTFDNGNVYVIRAWSTISSSTISNVVTSIRNEAKR